MYVLAIMFDLHLPACRSLKAKRAVVRPIVDTIRSRYRLSVAEVAEQDRWQRAVLGVAAVSGEAAVAEALIDEVERYVWSIPEVEVIAADRTWLEPDS